MSVTLERHAKLETVQVEVAAGMDGQGMPEYATPVDIQARVSFAGGAGAMATGERVMRLPSGQEVLITVAMWVNATENPLPALDDRVTTASGFVGIVVDRSEVKSIAGGVLDHIRLGLREE